MRGTGFTCDQCKAEAIDDSMPQGWVALIERKDNPFGAHYQERTHEFCSFVCLAAFGAGAAADELEASA